MIYFLRFTFLLGLVCSTSLAKYNKLTPFQKNIKSCLSFEFDIEKVQNLNDLYSVLDKQFSLKTSETIYREVIYKDKAEVKKLKFEKGVISIYKVLDDETVKLVNNDARQKGLTDESSINQLLQQSDIRSDWVKVKEVRSQQSLLYFGRQKDQFKSIEFEQVGQKAKLECLNKEASDICLCRL